MTPQLSKGIAALKIEFAAEFASGDIVHIGITNCRRKNNLPTSPWSEHAWSNAGDIMLRNWSGRKALGTRIAAWMRSRPDLWSEVFWWVAAHYDHVHGTAAPRRNHDNKQTPPCAGGETGDEAEMEELVKLIQTAINATPVTPKLVVDGIWGIQTHNRFVTALQLGPTTAGGVTEAKVKEIIRKATLNV